VRFAKECHPDDLWVSYFTSSKRVKALRDQYGDDSFDYEVRQTFNSINAAREWECKVLKRMKVLSKPDQWINRTDNRAILNEIQPSGMRGKRAWNKDIKMTEQQTVKMRKPRSNTSKMGRYERTNVVLENMSQSQKVSWKKVENQEKERRFARLKTIASNRGNRGQKWRFENGKRVYYRP